jgi:hypothetical protein
MNGVEIDFWLRLTVYKGDIIISFFINRKKDEGAENKF